MKFGDRIKVYHRVRYQSETCPTCQARSSVAVCEVKFITVTHSAIEFVKALNCDTDGYGTVLYAVDAQGRKYRKAPHWDGPRATLWMRQDGKPFDQYPPKTFSRDINGRVLSL